MHTTARRVAVWALRLAWAALALTVAPAIGQALDGRSRPVQVTATVGCWLVWGFVLAASLVPSTAALTVVRALVPTAIVVAALAWIADASAAAGAIAVLTAALATAITFAAEVGRAFVQASAYGDEQRFLLRLPPPLLVLVPLAWALAVGVLISGTLALAARAWFVGGLLATSGAAVSWFLAPRLHRLSKRWLVTVPAGLVVHDVVMLFETVMVPTADFAGAVLVEHRALQLRFRRPLKVTRTPRPGATPQPVEVTELVVGPSRPGQALAAITNPPPRTKRSVAS